jgi:hypothetical protein
LAEGVIDVRISQNGFIRRENKNCARMGFHELIAPSGKKIRDLGKKHGLDLTSIFD